MTGTEALQALREGKKVTNSSLNGNYFACVLEYEMAGKSYKEIAWVGTWEPGPVNPYMWCGGDPFDGSDFLTDDWEIVE
jgi:hypothetical protein